MSNYNHNLGSFNVCSVQFQETKILWHVKRHFWRKCWSTLRKTIVLLKPQTFFRKVVANLKLMLLDWRWHKDWNAHVTQHGCKHTFRVSIAISVECFLCIFCIWKSYANNTLCNVDQGIDIRRHQEYSCTEAIVSIHNVILVINVLIEFYTKI